MAEYFTESPTWAYFTLGTVAIILVFVYFTTKRGLYLGLIGVAALLALAVFLIDVFVESDNEAVVRLTKEMLAAAEKKDLDAFGSYFSEQFRTDAGTNAVTKAELIRRARPVLPQLNSVRGRVFQVEKPDLLGRSRSVGCMVDATGTVEGFTLDGQTFHLKLRYVKDDDGVWRIRSFEVWDAMGQRMYYP